MMNLSETPKEHHRVRNELFDLINSDCLHNYAEIDRIKNLMIDIYQLTELDENARRKVHSSLANLLDRIKSLFSAEERPQEIQEVIANIIAAANQILPGDINTIPNEVKQLIVLKSLPERQGLYTKNEDGLFLNYTSVGKRASTLSSTALVSKEFYVVSESAKKLWMDEQAVSLRTVGCKNAEEAVQYVIDKGLASANFEGFTDLSDAHLIRLVDNCPKLEFLMINSNSVTDAGAAKIADLHSLKILYIVSQKIGSLNLAQCKKLQEVLLECSELTELALPKEAACLQYFDSSHCQKLIEIDLENASSLKELRCNNCINLYRLILPDRPEALEYFECTNCFKLPRINLEWASSLKELECNYCKTLGELILPESSDTLESIDFSNCFKLTQVCLPKIANALKKISCINGRGLTQLILPASAGFLKSLILANCNELTQLILPKVTPLLNNIQCSDCSKLSTLTLPRDAPILREVLCYGCSSLTQLHLPQNATMLENMVYSNCPSLVELTFPSYHNADVFK